MSDDNSLQSSPQLAFEGAAVALSGKQIQSLYKKSKNSGIPFDVLEQVYQRGYNSWHPLHEETAEQIAFNRVNSFVAGGAAIQLDYDLLEDKITRDAFLYMPPKQPKNNFAQCSTCDHFMPGKKRCSLFSKDDVVVAEASCGLYAHGKPHDDQKFINATTPEQAGYVNHEVRCENCSWYSKRKCGLFEVLNSKARGEFELNTNVDPKGCCNGWQPKEQVNEMNEEKRGLWANIHAKRERIKKGSGEHMRKPGQKGAPTPEQMKRAMGEAYTGAEKVSKDPNKASNRFNGTKSLVDNYKKATPGQSQTAKIIKKVVKEQYECENCTCGLNESENWQKAKYKNPEGGLTKAGVMAYRRENPGSKLQTAVTTKPSKLKKGSKAAKRRKSFCSRMKGMKKRLTSAETARDPDSRINKALRKWNC